MGKFGVKLLPNIKDIMTSVYWKEVIGFCKNSNLDYQKLCACDVYYCNERAVVYIKPGSKINLVVPTKNYSAVLLQEDVILVVVLPVNDTEDVVFYLGIMGVGYMLSILAGACVGIYAKNQMSATSLAMPLMMILGFLPMLALFNEKIKSIAKFFYTQQIRAILDEMSFDSITRESVIIVVVNMIVVIASFFILFRKKGLE